MGGWGDWARGEMGGWVGWGGSKGIEVKVVFHVDRNNIQRFLVLFHYCS